MLLKTSVEGVYINNKLSKTFIKDVYVISILRLKENDIKADLKKDFIIIILKFIIYYKIMISFKINKSLIKFTLLYKTFLLNIPNFF